MCVLRCFSMFTFGTAVKELIHEKPFTRALAWLFTMTGSLAWLRPRPAIFFILACMVCYVARRLSAGGKCPPVRSQKGKTILVTGANNGIGLEAARVLAMEGAHVLMCCRNKKKAKEAARSVMESVKVSGGSGSVEVFELDLSSFASVRQCAQDVQKKYKKLDAIINNAGLMMCPFSLTADGHEMQMGTNHLGHFLLTNLLLDLVRASKGRIVNVGSLAHTFCQEAPSDLHDMNVRDPASYDKIGPGASSYSFSKIANLWFTHELQRRVTADEVFVYCVHPGTIRTGIAQHLHPVLQFLFKWVGPLFTKSPEEGAQTTLYCATQPVARLRPGGYYSDCEVAQPSKLASDSKQAAKFWKISEEWCGL